MALRGAVLVFGLLALASQQVAAGPVLATCLRKGASCTALGPKCCSESLRRKPLSAGAQMCCAVTAGTSDATEGTCQEAAQPEFQCLYGQNSSADSKITGFDGSVFRFQARPGQIFNMLSEQHHQVNAYFSAGSDPEDASVAYITAFGIKINAQTIKVEVLDSGLLQVQLNGGQLHMHSTQTAIRVTIHDDAAPSDKITLKWDLYRRAYGNSVQVRSAMLDLLVYAVPPGSLETGDFGRPAFLNSQMKLLRAPDSPLEGILGRTFRAPRTGGAAGVVIEKGLPSDEKDATTTAEEHDFNPGGFFGSALPPRPQEDFLVADLFGDTFAANQFNPSGQELGLKEEAMDMDWFPMEASTEVRWNAKARKPTLASSATSSLGAFASSVWTR